MKQNRIWQNELKRSYRARSCTSVVCVLDVPGYVFRSCCQVWFSMPDMWPAVFVLIGLFVNTDTFIGFRHFTSDKGQGEMHFKYWTYIMQTKYLRLWHCHIIKLCGPCSLVLTLWRLCKQCFVALVYSGLSVTIVNNLVNDKIFH